MRITAPPAWILLARLQNISLIFHANQKTQFCYSNCSLVQFLRCLNKFDLTQDYLLCMGGSVWVDLIELVRHKHARSHKSFFTSPGRPTPLWAPHNHTHSLNKGSLGALNDYTKCIHKPILLHIQFSITPPMICIIILSLLDLQWNDSNSCW